MIDEDKRRVASIPNLNFAAMARSLFSITRHNIGVPWTGQTGGDSQSPDACCRPLQLLFQQLGGIRGKILVQDHFDLFVTRRLLHWTSREHGDG